MQINIEKIARKYQRYDTSGDYWMDKKGVMQVRISASSTKEFFLILMHELTEAFLTKFRKISWKKIDEFDQSHLDLDEPGDSKEAPYHREHMMGNKIESVLEGEVHLYD